MNNVSFIPQAEPSFDINEAEALRQYILDGGWVTEFKKTSEFEERLCAFTGASHCIAAPSGTAALTLSFLAIGGGPGAEAIIPDLTMIATPNSISLTGAKPVFVDIEPRTLNMDIEGIEQAITPKTKAVIHVSLNGRSNDLAAVKDICQSRKLALIEDAAQSLGSFFGERHLGTIGDLGCLSFSPPKIISTGQGGAVLTNNKELAQKIRKLKDFGRLSGGHDIHDSIGFNFKFTDAQALIGIEQMKKLPWRMERKKEIYNRYRKNLEGIKEIDWIETDIRQVTPWFVDVYVDDRDSLGAHLQMQGIGTRPIYPAIHLQRAYSLGGLSFPVAENFARRGLWLPSSVTLADAQIDRVCAAICSYFGGNGI